MRPRDSAMHLRAIDGMRALAVLGVVANHAALLPWSIGARGVELFFVISGFCLSLPTLARMQAGEPFAFDRARFAIGRILRIVPPYYVALLGFVVLSATAFGVPTVTAAPARFEWLEDALFLTSGAPAYNASFWTLGIEARWYVFFPAVLALYVQSKRLFAVFALACYAVYLAQNSIVDAGTLPCFMLGIVAADLYVRGKAGSRAFPIAALVCFALATLADHSGDPGDPLWHAAAFFTVVAGVGAGAKVAAWRPLVAVGTASYSIYLVHQPLIFWFAKLAVPWPLCGIASVAVGFAFWRLVEKPSLAAAAAFRKRRSRMLGAQA